MIDLRTLIQSELSAVHARVYFMEAPETATYPYLVYDIPNIYDDGEEFQLINLEIDGWDDDPDTTALETLMSAVNTRLNKKVLSTENLSVVFYLENKKTITDDDPRINRRHYTYFGRKFGG